MLSYTFFSEMFIKQTTANKSQMLRLNINLEKLSNEASVARTLLQFKKAVEKNSKYKRENMCYCENNDWKLTDDQSSNKILNKKRKRTGPHTHEQTNNWQNQKKNISINGVH